MIRHIAHSLIAFAAKCLDQTVPTKQLHELLRKGLDDFKCRTNGDSEKCADIALAECIAAEAGVISTDRSIPFETSDSIEDVVSKEAMDQWIANVPNGRVVTAGKVAPGTGRWLDRIDSAGHKSHRDFIDNNINMLLRHVEIRTTRCLLLDPPSSPADSWQEKFDVAILLARSARRRSDFRLLNAALKLNDWSYPANRKLPVPPRYLLALAEQEWTIKELMS